MKLIIFLIFFVLSGNVLAEKCPDGAYSVISHYRSDYTRQDGTYVSAANVKESCRPYTFLKPLKVTTKNEMPLNWPNKKEKFKRWTAKEKKELKLILKSLPNILTQIGELKIFRANQSKWPENGATTAAEENIITLYDKAESYGLKKVLVHELSHILWKNLDRSNKEKYFSDADWALNTKGEVINQRAVISEEDGRLSPEEDFANNVEHLITNKNYKKKISPAIENCLKNILGIKNDK
jgi:hypothetical protein